MEVDSSVVPPDGLVPKQFHQVMDYLKKNPKYDGRFGFILLICRGTIVAIFDSGVDPGASGLQVI
jgi:tripeptidyl-peptidase-2